jgi:hypothetical protein
MMFISLLVLLTLIVLMLFSWRQLDHRADARAMHRLAAMQPEQVARFDQQMVAELPEPARRYFLYTIEPGTPLYTVANISMSGQFGMGDKHKPNYLQMTAEQTLAMPAGFVWKMRAQRGMLKVSGSDTEQWTRFWLMDLLPVARMGGDSDHRRSAFARYVAEAVFWTPAAVLPGPGISWTQLAPDCARLTVSHQGLSQSVDVTVAANGQPTEVRFERWTNANADKQYRLQPFGGYLSRFRSFAGYRLPTKVEAGNHFDTDKYFAFFVAEITDISFPHD